jgi:hypothetical protein
MKLDLYDENNIYVNAHENCGGDFHFVMNYENALKFKTIYDTTKSRNVVTEHDLHGKIKMFVEYYLNDKLVMDDIKPGLDQEVLRKVKLYPINQFKIPIETFTKYGLTLIELDSYVV